MPIQKYLELDSTYRNRNVDSNPASFTFKNDCCSASIELTDKLFLSRLILIL